MRLLLGATIFWFCVLLLSVLMIGFAQSPPAAYLGAMLGATALAGLCVTLGIIFVRGLRANRER
jgi:hypothetical protein